MFVDLFFSLDYLGYLRYIVVEVASSKNDKHIKVATLHEVEHVLLVYHALLHTLSKVIVDELRSNSRYRLLACWIDVAENHLVEL